MSKKTVIIIDDPLNNHEITDKQRRALAAWFNSLELHKMPGALISYRDPYPPGPGWPTEGPQEEPPEPTE